MDRGRHFHFLQPPGTRSLLSHLRLLGVKEELVQSFTLSEPIVITSQGRRGGEEERSVGPAPTGIRLLPSSRSGL